MRKNLSILLLAFVATMSIQSAKAWGTFGHGAIAYVAEQHLTPKAKEECRRYLKHTLPYYASWMDHWRAVPPFHPTNNWHGFSMNAEGELDWSKGGKAMGQLQKIMKEMGNGNYKNLPDSLVRHHLLILVHSVPDMHCPVHVGGVSKVKPEYRGIALKNKKKSVKFHGFWDGSPGFTRKGWSYEKYAAEVDNLTPKQVKKIVKKGNFDYWGRDIIKQSFRAYEITPNGTDISKLTAEEKADVLALADEMAMKAAYRLAYVLNEIFNK